MNLLSGWKTWMIFAAILVLLLSTAYTYFVTKKLAAREKNTIDLIATVIEDLSENQDFQSDVDTELEVIKQNRDIPLMWVSERDEILEQYNFQSDGEPLDEKYLRKELERLKKEGPEPLVLTTYYTVNNTQTSYIYYKHSPTLRLLSLFPLFQLLLIATFVVIGLFGLNQAKRAEQNRVWAGLAKETAHQLGTPISAIMAWISLLDNTLEKTDANQEILTELDKDVSRLNLIAERFSKVGSKPELTKINIKELVREALDYMSRRASRNVRFIFDEEQLPDLEVHVNPPLFEWVVENLLRNALDAMDGRGNVIVDIYKENNRVCLDISDTGKGIPANRFKKVFDPGYSTKKRGWGLGLSLAKRIIEMYHKGRIYVKESKINVGTTFTIQLPK